jgi:methylmalonyl-CoA mutase cobalamin-binding subunit
MSEAVDFRALLPSDLPSGSDCHREGVELGRRVERGVSIFCEHHGVRSEREFRERARAEGRHCTSVNIGLATWADTRDALGAIYEDALSRGVVPPDNFTLLAERRMGLPRDMWVDAPQETGPVLWTEQDWWELTHTVPIQPGAEDNIIGGPGSVPNALQALQVGVTTVGVLSQYFWRWPYWNDDVAQTAAVVTAAGALSAWRHDGVCFNSYLDDGYPGVFHDYANLVGWAMVERYASEQLLEVPFSASWGGLSTDPVTKAAVSRALQLTNPSDVPPSFMHGDTIGNGPDIEANAATASVDVLFMKATDAHYRIGAAVKAVPITEAVRVPTWREVAAVHAMNRRLEQYMPTAEGNFGWARIEAIAATLVEGAKRFFANLLTGLKRGGVDVRDPVQFLLTLKTLGAVRAEELFGAGEPDSAFPRGRRPVMQTDLLHKTLEERDAAVGRIRELGRDSALAGQRIIVASTDVHELAVMLLRSALAAAGGEIIDFGISRDPEDIAKAAVETDAGAVVVTTHNGVARSFGKRLLLTMEQAGIGGVPIYMGGVLNEDVEDSDVPIDVTKDLIEMGIRAPAGIPELVSDLGDQVRGLGHSMAYVDGHTERR